MDPFVKDPTIIESNEVLFYLGKFHTENAYLVSIMYRHNYSHDLINEILGENDLHRQKAIRTSDIEEIKACVHSLDVLFERIKYGILTKDGIL